MSRASSISVLGSEFDDFLFAAICEDGNGTPLSVVSALTRLDVDPWQEAAKLARLPGNTATQRLASLISAQTDGLSTRLDAGTIAARLISLLPGQAHPNTSTREVLPGVRVMANSRAPMYVIVYVIFMSFMLVAQIVVASRQLPARIDNAHEPTTSAVSPLPSPQRSGQ